MITAPVARSQWLRIARHFNSYSIEAREQLASFFDDLASDTGDVAFTAYADALRIPRAQLTPTLSSEWIN